MTRFLETFLRDESGSATVEFVLVGPVFIALFLMTFEMGISLTRQVMLDRGLDMTVRLVRLGKYDSTNPTHMHDQLKATICQVAAMIPNCSSNLKLKMQQVDPRNWVSPGTTADCVDRGNSATLPASNFTPGVANQLMLLRACALFDPIMPNIGLGKVLKGSKGYYALTASTAYVVEPA